MSTLHIHSIWVQFVWYPWYQSPSVALKCLTSEFVKCSILSGTNGRVPVNSAKCHQDDYDADRCTSIAECYQVCYNVVLNESIIVLGLECHLCYCIYRHCFYKDYNYVKKFPRDHQSFQCHHGQQYSTMQYSIIVWGYYVLTSICVQIMRK
jgi:hypothetical protein